MNRTCNILWVAERILGEILRHRPIFLLKSWCSLKKKESSLVIRPRFLIFSPKIVLFSRKNKVFVSDRPHVSLILFKNSGVLHSVEKYRSSRTNSLVTQSLPYVCISSGAFLRVRRINIEKKIKILMTCINRVE